jgi:hypothetical protein
MGKALFFFWSFFFLESVESVFILLLFSFKGIENEQLFLNPPFHTLILKWKFIQNMLIRVNIQ